MRFSLRYRAEYRYPGPVYAVPGMEEQRAVNELFLGSGWAYPKLNDAKGKDMYFRLYDPRVLRVFLPTCTPDELTDFFGPIGTFLIESDKPAHGWLCSREPGYPLRLEDLAL